MSSKRPILNLDGMKVAKLFPLIIALAAIVFTLFWARSTNTDLGLGDLIFRFVAGIGISVNFGMSLFEMYSDAKKSLLRKEKDEEIDLELIDLSTQQKQNAAAITEAHSAIRDMKSEMAKTSAELLKIQSSLSFTKLEIPVPLPG